MAPTEAAPALLQKRYCYGNYPYTRCDEYSAWYFWGRWVFLGVLVIFFVLILFFLRRRALHRRRAGLAPLRGTGWMAPPPPYQPGGGGPPVYSAQPPVGPQHTGQKFNQGEGYYGQQEGINLQSPPQAYQPPQSQYQQPNPYPSYPRNDADTVYAPPEGPPPTRK